MTKVQILQRVESLDYEERWQFMIKQGVNSLKSPSLQQALLSLAESDIHYERILALMSAYGSHDKQMIERLLLEPSSFYSFCINKLGAQHLGDKQLQSIVPKLSKQRRPGMYYALCRARRENVNDLFYAQLGLVERKELLPYTSKTFVETHLDRHSVDELSTAQWKRIAKRFPVISSQLLQDALDSTKQPSWQLQNTFGGVLQILGRNAPEVGFGLLKGAAARLDAKNLPFKQYACLYPEDTAALILKSPSKQSVNFSINTLKRLSGAIFIQLEKRGISFNLEDNFSKLTSENRFLLYKECKESWRDTYGALPLSYAKGLPEKFRELEARHAFNLPQFASSPLMRFPYLELLPFSEALELGQPFLTQPEGELRAEAVAAIVKTGRYDSAALEAILDFCIKRRNEQDPVRLEMFLALGSLPPTRWQSVHLPKIKEIIGDALKARDCSQQTMMAAAQMLLAMLPTQIEFVVAELPILVKRQGHLSTIFGWLESRITDAEALRLASALLPLLKSWIGADKRHIALGMIYSFGYRAKAVPAFSDLMIKLTDDKRGHIAQLGLEGLMRLKFSNEVASLIPKLIKNDVSWIQAHQVANYLHRHRQSLLTPFLTAQPYKGRFSTNRVAKIPGFDNGFVRWTCTQQNLYAESLNAIINSKKHNAWELYQSVARLAALPSVTLNSVIQQAQLEAKDSALRDKALEALGRADAGRGVPSLLEALDDARARVAIYALRRTLLNMSTQKALTLLANVPSRSVTVTKEVVRLIGEFEGDEGYAALNQFRTQELHPDVEIALLRAFWTHLERDDVWELFYNAARSPRAALTRSTIRIPQEGLSSEGKKRLAHQMTLLLDNSDAQVKRETLVRLAYMPLGYSDSALREALLNQLEDIDPLVTQYAAEALLMAYAPEQDKGVIDQFGRVADAKTLVAIVAAFDRLAGKQLQGLEWSAQALADALLERRWQPAQAAHVVLMHLNPKMGLGFLIRLDEAGLLHPGVVDMASLVWNDSVVKNSKENLEVVEEELRNASASTLRRIGLGLLCALAQWHGWQVEWRTHLLNYQKDKELWVSDAAELIELPEVVKAEPAI